MNFKRMFAIALAVNVALLALALWLWNSRRQATGAALSPPAQSLQPTAVEPEPQPKEAALAPVELSPERLQRIGVTFGTAEMRRVGEDLRATGTVEVNERQLAYVQTRISGWLRKVYVNATYQFVRKGQPLFTIYSPDLVATQQEYLLARKNQTQLQASSVPGVSEGARSLVSSARERLKQWDISELELARVESTNKPVSDFTIYSPVTGYVTERGAVPNMFVQPETKLYTIADLSSVWINVQVFQSDVGKLKPGDPAEVTVDAYSGKAFRGRVEQILPQVDVNTRTVAVRLSLSNPGLLLKPGMFVNVALKSQTINALTIPASAVLQSGARQVVFLDRGNGRLNPVKVELGARYGNDFVVLKGLRSGDRVVTSANFLVDSESQLQAAAGMFTPPPPGAGAAASMNQPQTTAQEANVLFTSEPDPPRKGANTFRVKLASPDGKPVNGAQVKVTFFMPAMPAMGMSEMKTEVILDDRGNGLYEGKGELGSGGTWQVTITAQQNSKVIAMKRITVSATGGM